MEHAAIDYVLLSSVHSMQVSLETIKRGKKEDILFHGLKHHCDIEGVLFDMLMEGKLELYGNSHPTERIPIPSDDDRNTLVLI